MYVSVPHGMSTKEYLSTCRCDGSVSCVEANKAYLISYSVLKIILMSAMNMSKASVACTKSVDGVSRITVYMRGAALEAQLSHNVGV